MINPHVDLNDGCKMPRLGFGVFQIPPEETCAAVKHALQIGYRSIDTAAAYGNEADVGEAVQASGLPRGEVFVTSKLWNDDHGHAAALAAYQRSLDALRFAYIDLYLIHWPVPSRNRYLETWQALTELKSDRQVRSIGVSNFLTDHLERIIDATGVTPAVNQIELHPHLQQPELREFHTEQGIITEAWSPLGKGGVLSDPVIERIAREHGRTPAQVVLRWHLQLGNVVIPKSITPERIEENARVFDFELSEEQMEEIAGLDRGRRTGPDPARFAAA